MTNDLVPPDSVGQNAWLVEEMYQDFRDNPTSVSDAWQEFFADFSPRGTARPAEVAATPATATSTPAAVTAAVTAAITAPPDAGAGDEPAGQVIRGAAARIVENMQASLAVPTATSFREVPARLLEVNRSIINGYLGRTRGGKVSFTHLIGYAVVRAIADHLPVMNSTYSIDDGTHRVTRHPHVGLGVAVDLEKSDGSRTLLVPCIRDADTLDFNQFVDRYEEVIRKVRTNRLSPDDMGGVTVSLTNPGTIGTLQSVPRLMPGQGVIVGVGTIDYPTEYQGADLAKLAELGISKIVTISSTYDHRVIQGAESGLFLKKVHELLIGEDGFYDSCFRSVGVPYESVRWRTDVNPVDTERSMLEKQAQVNALVSAYRVRGHLIADLDPLASKPPGMHPELDPATYGLTIWDLEREFLISGYMGLENSLGGGRSQMKLGDLLHLLRDAYCRTIGIEYMHLQDPIEKVWIQNEVEGADTRINPIDQRHILERLNAAEALERFLGTKYLGQKRFGIEGAESAIPILDHVLCSAADAGMAEAVLGMAHRGRLNVLVNIVGKSYEQLFDEFEGHVSPDSTQGSGDVKYHLGQRGKFVSRAGNTIAVELAANPSHLEAVDPVVVGMARAKMDQIEPPGDYPILPLLIHGDAAFAGQGVVAETLNLSQIKGYRVGGTIHLIINNQLGFTTAPQSARSSDYCTDVAKMVQAPIFHVNGDDPEACIRVAELAFAYRQTFHKDVVIDMVCYRRHGHNEGDDPSYTQPLMYRAIDARRSVRKIYTEALIKRGDITLDEAEAALEDFQRRLQQALDETRSHAPAAGIRARIPLPAAGVLPHVRTAVDPDLVQRVYRALGAVPDGFTVHPKLAKQFETRDAMFHGGEIDWALGEAMAFGTLLADGVSVRLAGQDSRRGTFSHRHSTLVDYHTGAEHVPLAALAEDRTRLWIYDSLLSEYAALGFEYGYSIANPDVLTIWEAQFGDFVNGAQIIIDQFLVAAEDKWGQMSGLVLLLPHGLEGQGPEHSSGRMERFLTMAAEDNIQVVNATTAAQLFHLLRRQMVRDVRRPLVVFTPKSLLRSKHSRSTVAELCNGTFEEVLDDPGVVDAAAVRRVIFCNGKVAFELMARRDELAAPAAVVRVEQLFPWPSDKVAGILDRYPNATEIQWLQEEPENMGAWNPTKGRLYERHEHTHRIQRNSRFESGSPATGSAAIHMQEHQDLLARAFADL